jgi:hypothetical protein
MPVDPTVARLALSVAWLCASVALANPAPAQRIKPVQLAPHRAVYDFQMTRARTSSIASVSGRMVYEFTGSACDGYTQTMRFVTRSHTQSGEVSLSDQRTTSWENSEGTSYRFQSSQYRDRKIAEQTAGTATRSAEPGADVVVNLTHPDQRSTAVGAGSLFPVQHSIKVIEAAMKGQTMFRAPLFDGSEGGEKTYMVSAHIGRPASAAMLRKLPRVDQSGKLEGVAAWPIALAYFEHGQEDKDAVPSYEMSFLFYANGVSRKLVIDNGDYTLTGTLAELTMLDRQPCRN